MTTHCRVWVRGGLGNQIASLCAAFVAVERIPMRTSSIVLDGTVVDASHDPTRRFQLHNFVLLDSTGRVRIETVKSRGRLVRGVRSLARRGINRMADRYGWPRAQFSGHPLQNEGLASSPRYLDGHFEHTDLAVKARNLGLRFPLELRSPSDQFRRAMELHHEEEVAVHVRMTDYTTWYGGRFLLGPDYYRSALRKLGFEPSTVRVCVFSDDQRAASHMLVDAGINEKRMRFSPLANPAEDLLYLASFAHQVTSHSTFSFWAAFMNTKGVHSYPWPEATMRGLPEWKRVSVRTS